MENLITRYAQAFSIPPREINQMLEKRSLWDKYQEIRESTKKQISEGYGAEKWQSIDPEKQQKAITLVAEKDFGMTANQIERMMEQPELRNKYESVKEAARNRVVGFYGEKKWQSVDSKSMDRMIVRFANTDFNMPPEKIGEMIQHSSQYIRGLNGLPPEQRKKAIGELNSDYGKWVDWNKESEGQAEAAPEISRERQRESDLEL